MRTKKTVFILISGKAGVGKTTLGNYLTTHIPYTDSGISVINTAFANSIKSLAKKHFGWNGEKDSKGRRLLQVIGTEAGREYDENIWVRKTVENVLQMNIFPPNFVIIDDWRYPNECTYIQDLKIHDVVTIRVAADDRETLKGTKEYNHISEISLDNWNGFNFMVDNSSNYGDLYTVGDDIVASLQKVFILE